MDLYGIDLLGSHSCVSAGCPRGTMAHSASSPGVETGRGWPRVLPTPFLWGRWGRSISLEGMEPEASL